MMMMMMVLVVVLLLMLKVCVEAFGLLQSPPLVGLIEIQLRW